MDEYAHKRDEKVKAMKSEIKENELIEYRELNERKKTRTQINSLDQKE